MDSSYNITETAELLGVSLATVYSYERNGLLKREEDPHHLKSGMTFPKDKVDELVKEKKELDKAGPSVSDFSKNLGINTTRVTDAIRELDLTVPMVRTGIRSNRMRYALTPEQERQLTDFLSKQRTTRAKRNHLYFPGLDLALFQTFLIAGEQRVRLILNEKKEPGFRLDSGDFIPYMSAVQTYDIEPLYGIHKKKIKNQQGFSDIEVPTGKKAFFQILDTLYNVCGIENFNADLQKGALVISVRNGSYIVDYPAASLETVRRYLTSGTIEVIDGAWNFQLTKRNVQLQIDSEDYALFKEEAVRLNVSVKELLENHLNKIAKDIRG